MEKSRLSLAVIWLAAVYFMFLSVTTKAEENIGFNSHHIHQMAEAEHQKFNLTLGVLSFRSKTASREQWQPLVDYFNHSLPNTNLSLAVFTFPELQQAIENKKIDFILTNSANYVQLTHKFGLSAPLASLINDSNGIPIFDFAGAILIHKNHPKIKKLNDLKQLRIATPSRQSFGGYMMQAYELKKAGINLNKDLRIIETGMPHDTAVTALLNNEVDVAFVRTGVLESLRDKAPELYKNIIVINQPDSHYPFALSTQTYPEWPFAALPHTNTIIAGQIAGKLLTLEHGSQTTQKIGIHGFSIPADYEPIREVLRSLRVYPYEAAPEFTYQDIWNQYPYEIIQIVLALIIITLLTIKLLTVNSRLKSHQQQLEAQTTSLAIAAVAFDTQQAILIATPDEKIIRVNNAFTEITGYQPDEIIGKTPRIFKSNYHTVEFYEDVWQHLKKEGFWQGEIWNRRKSGEIYPLGQSIKAITNKEGLVTHYLSTFTDITLHKENEQKIKELAFYDPLTRLANRRLLKDHLLQTMNSSEHDNDYFAIMFIDLDNFKTLNDSLGHHYGDLLLQQLAKRLTESMHDEVTIARPGGDEFILLIPNLSRQEHRAIQQAKNLADKVLTTIGNPYDLAGLPYTIGASIGITICRGKERNIDELLMHSDLAMYQSKTTGKNKMSFFDPAMQAEIEKRSSLENDLRTAIKEKQFQLFYQPKLSANDKLVGYEALIRWHHPQKGMIAPNDFIPLAEETGLILDIGQWVLETACRQLNQWAKNSNTRHLSIAINVSEHQLKQKNFVNHTLQSIAHCTVNPALLEIEITESQLMANMDDNVAKMQALQKSGITFSLDDFGTGYSSLVYLKALPITTLKIDQSFVRDMLQDSESQAIVKTIISLAHTLNLKLVAEGVETEAQKDFLIASGCHYLQGYLLGKPMPIEQITYK